MKIALALALAMTVTQVQAQEYTVIPQRQRLQPIPQREPNFGPGCYYAVDPCHPVIVERRTTRLRFSFCRGWYRETIIEQYQCN